jgi:hypothetical protein
LTKWFGSTASTPWGCRQNFFSKKQTTIRHKINVHLQNLGIFWLASPVEKSQMAPLMLVAHQIPMLWGTVVTFAGFLGKHTNLNGQMAPLNLNGKAQGMWLAAACCWPLEMECPYSSPAMAF